MRNNLCLLKRIRWMHLSPVFKKENLMVKRLRRKEEYLLLLSLRFLAPRTQNHYLAAIGLELALFHLSMKNGETFAKPESSKHVVDSFRLFYFCLRHTLETGFALSPERVYQSHQSPRLIDGGCATRQTCQYT